MRQRRHGNSALEQPLLADVDDDELDGDYVKVAPRTPDVTPSNSIDRQQAINAWQDIFAGFILQWAGWLRHLLIGGQSMVAAIGESIKSLPLLQRQKSTTLSQPQLPPIQLTPTQEERLRALQQRIGVAYDKDSPEHEAALQSLWDAAYPTQKRTADNEAEGWKDMGWQGNHPSTDFRGGGVFALENLVYFAQHYPSAFRTLMLKQEGKRAEWEYPFAAAGVNLTVLLVDMLDLRREIPNTLPGRTFLNLLQENEHAFEDLYCILFNILDAQWLEMKASYMEFNVVLKATRALFEQTLSNSALHSLADLPETQRLTRS